MTGTHSYAGRHTAQPQRCAQTRSGRGYVQPRPRTSRKPKRKNRVWQVVLLLAIIAAAIVVIKHLGLSGPALKVTAPKNNIVTDYNVGEDLTDIRSSERFGKGGGDADPADAEKLRALAEKYTAYRSKLIFIADNIGDFSNNGVKSVLTSPEKVDFVLRAAYGPRENSTTKKLSVKKGQIPFLLQYDSRWAFHNYGSSYLGYTACGPTCLSMAAAGLTGNTEYTPEYVADFAEENGYYIAGTGTSWSLFTDGAAKLGLSCEGVGLSENAMEKALKGGGVLIASMTSGDFTSAGHFIVIYKSGLGGFRVYDPSSIERSSRAWSYDRLKSQIAQLWRFTEA